MIEREQQAERKPVLRKDFGPSKFGEIAYQTILAGARCETFIEEIKDQCEEISDRTVDFDVLGNAEFRTACSDEHEKLIKLRIRREAEDKGSEIIPDFSNNGWGRALANS
ncbi:hypothetical protein M1349_03255 [Patescibacteria group bacterium]|nr:hypothetical protein [Patescibacteria group bacterium]